MAASEVYHGQISGTLIAAAITKQASGYMIIPDANQEVVIIHDGF